MICSGRRLSSTPAASEVRSEDSGFSGVIELLSCPPKPDVMLCTGEFTLLTWRFDPIWAACGLAEGQPHLVSLNGPHCHPPFLSSWDRCLDPTEATVKVEDTKERLL